MQKYGAVADFFVNESSALFAAAGSVLLRAWLEELAALREAWPRSVFSLVAAREACPLVGLKILEMNIGVLTVALS